MERQGILAHLLSWSPPSSVHEEALPLTSRTEAKMKPIGKDILAPVALLLSAGGWQASDLLCSHALELLGSELTSDQVDRALENLGEQGVLESSPDGWRIVSSRLDSFLEQLGLHPYVRELAALLGAEEIQS